MLNLVARQLLEDEFEVAVACGVEECDQRRHALGLGDAGLRNHLVRQPLLRTEVSGPEEQQPRLGGRDLRLKRAQNVGAVRSVANLVGGCASRQLYQVGRHPRGAHPFRERSKAQRGPGLDTVAHRPDLRDQGAGGVYQIVGPP